MQTVAAKTILTRSKSSAWFGTDFTMNIYRGCCHGCIYCDSRSDCYNVGNFDQVRKKQDALRIIRDELARRVKRGVVASGAMSDPYNPFERDELLTRHSLELLHAYQFGAALCTKSDLIVRDADVLQDIAVHSPVLCKITITAAEDPLAAKLEPHAPASSRRFAAVEALAQKGLFAGVLLMPVMPFLTDSEANIGAIVDRAAASGARFVYPAFGVTARSGQREHMLAQLEKLYPEERYADQYRKRFGSRYHWTSPRAHALWEFFVDRCRLHGLLYSMQDIVRAYKQGYETQQLSFL